MIDRRELLEEARERGLSLGMVEKDYVLGWLLFGFSGTDLVFKGGTALSKIFFPRIWRLSEDLDFSFSGKFEDLGDTNPNLSLVEEESGIKLELKSKYQNPEYLQLKIQYQAVLGKNWAKVDVTREAVIEKALVKPILKSYSDYPSYSVRVMGLEEVFSEKLRALLERKRSRDYYDIWRLLALKTNENKVRKLFLAKCEVKGLGYEGSDQLLPANLEEMLKSYWERELSRLVYPVPDLREVIDQLGSGLGFLG